MSTINDLKQQAETDTPVLLFECSLASGDVERWCTHGISDGSSYFESRVLRHNLFDLQLSADDAMDGLSKMSLTLANADSAMSEINSAIGFKGAQLTAWFGFVDLSAQVLTSEKTVIFTGIAGDPEEISEGTLTLSFSNKLSLQRIPLPSVRLQRTCPWSFPGNTDQRRDGQTNEFSPFAPCGYSAGVPGGLGNLDGNGNPFTSCDKSRSQCQQRGMFDRDSKNTTRRFGGIEFVPSTITVRSFGEKGSHTSPVLANPAKYNDAVPLIFGTGWLKPPVVFARNDGNLTHLEILIGLGQVTNILKVIVNDVEIPIAVSGQDMTATGWYEMFASGARTGTFSNAFLDSNGKPLGDPYGSMTAISVVVPNRISSGASLPIVQVLLQGIQVESFGADGASNGKFFSSNPAWIILDILRRCGWSLAEIDLSSFNGSAAFCDELISSTDANGNTVQVPRYQTNLVLDKRQSAATLVRGVRVASSLMLRYGASGLLQLLPETTLARQQPLAKDGSNSIAPLDGGWPAYEFCDGSAGYSGILRLPSGTSSVKLQSRTIAESSNRLSVEFQDEGSQYQQDSLSVVDSSDAALIGYEISSQSAALGLPNYNQATRVLLRQLDKNLRGNLFVEFATTFRALKIRPGDIITVTYLKEGFDRFPFRVTRLSPGLNYQVVNVTAQLHNDDWYSDDIAVLSNAGRQPNAGVQIPRPLAGIHPSKTPGVFDFAISESEQALSDGTALDLLTVSFSEPSRPSVASPRVPLVSLVANVSASAGTLPAASSFYYAFSSVDGAGEEGPLSFSVPAITGNASNTNSVQLNGLSFPSNAAAFNVYRGATPQMLYRIAANQAISSTFTDTGLAIQPILPPDPNFDHANFYYRYELAGPYLVSSAAATSVQILDLGATPGAYAGMLVRITSGTGCGQERVIQSNDQTNLTLRSPWITIPDQTSQVAICESAWHFAGVCYSSPVQFSVPFRSGNAVEVTGRAANVHNQESSPDLAPVTRIVLGESKPDFGVPAAPIFNLEAPGGGQLALINVGFATYDNVAIISSGSLNIHYLDELASASQPITAAIDGQSSMVSLTLPGSIQAGAFVSIGTEILQVLAYFPGSQMCEVLRGQVGTLPVAHNPGDMMSVVNTKIHTISFAEGMFQNRASVNTIHTLSLPDVRVLAADLTVSNGFGSSQAATLTFLSPQSQGLRTLSGGQFNMQVSGFVTSHQNASPSVTVDSTHAVRDARVVVGQAASGYTLNIDILQSGSAFCSLSIAPGQSASVLLDGLTLPILNKDSILTMNTTLLLTDSTVSQPVPPRDLAATIRL